MSDGGSNRLVSLDAFRGLTIAGMILVNNPGSWAYVYPPLGHAEWHGWTPTDLIFPYFLFIVGVALPFSFRRRLAEGADRAELFKHVVRRALILIGLGLAMRAIPDFDFGGMRYYGVLQRIGLVYLFAAGLYLFTSAWGRVWAAAVCLFGYWAVMTLLPVPGFGMPDLTPDGNLAGWVDRVVPLGALYQGTWDPEGLLSTIPAIGTSLLGIFTGEWLLGTGLFSRADEGDSGRRSGFEIASGLLVAGTALTIAGATWGLSFPINKNIWTSSYVVFTAGTGLLLFGSLYWAIDVKRWRGAWHTPLVVYGMNAIAVYVASGMLSKTMGRIRVGGEDGTSLWGWIYRNLFQSWAGDYNGSVAFALTYVAFWLGLMWVLHRRRIYIKI